MQLRNAVEDIVRQAGVLALTYEQHQADVRFKPEAGNSPVTAIDLAVNDFLYKELSKLDPAIGWLSEESVDDPARLTQERVWVVDPIDGTRSLLRYLEDGLPAVDDPRFGRRQFSVSVALVEAGQPVLGVIYAPLAEQLFSTQAGAGLTLNGEQMVPKVPPATMAECLVLTSVSETKAGLLTSLDQDLAMQSFGSAAYKMALVAAGAGDMFLSLKPKSEWDIAAGTLMVQEMGLTATDLAGQPFTFNQPNTERNGVIVAPNSLYQELKGLLPSTQAVPY